MKDYNHRLTLLSSSFLSVSTLRLSADSDRRAAISACVSTFFFRTVAGGFGNIISARHTSLGEVTYEVEHAQPLDPTQELLAERSSVTVIALTAFHPAHPRHPRRRILELK